MLGWTAAVLLHCQRESKAGLLLYLDVHAYAYVQEDVFLPHGRQLQSFGKCWDEGS